MKDVASKLSDWRDLQLPTQGVDINFLMQVQKQLLIFYKNNSDQVKGKYFPSIQQVSNFTQQQRVFWTKQYVLRIFDQISEMNAWKLQQDNRQNAVQNLVFQLVDILHFIFNIAITWEVEDNIKSFEQLCEDKPIRQIFIQAADLSRFTSQLLGSVSWKHWKNFQQRNKDQIAQKINDLLSHTITIANGLGYSYQDFYKMYISKNRENLNRQVFSQQYKN